MEILEITEDEAYNILSGELIKPDGNYITPMNSNWPYYICIRIRKGIISKNKWRVLKSAEKWLP